jgi:AraC family transcriptional regulator
MSATAIAAGTASERRSTVGPFTFSDLTFAPGCVLPWHEHPRACLAVVVDGRVRKRFARSLLDLGNAGVVSMQPREPHEDEFGRAGARLVVVESDDGLPDAACERDWTVSLIALRIARELAQPDAFTPLALEGLAYELFAAVGRMRTATRAAPWLEEARERLHDRRLAAPSATDLARQLGVHPSHLARSFRRAYGDSLGGYARRLRLEWAAERLVQTDVKLVCLARDAGFVDQSHFTRAFKRQFGVTPGHYRSAHR